MRKNIKTVVVNTPASDTPVSLAELKTYIKVDGSDEDSILTIYLEAATTAVENYMRRYTVNTTLDYYMDGFSDVDNDLDSLSGGFYDLPRRVFNDSSITLPHPPCVSVTSITTYDENDNASVYSASNYGVDTEYGRIYLNDDSTWPTDLRDNQAVKVEYIAGYGAATDVPAPIKQAILMFAGKMYDCKGSCDMQPACKKILDGYRLFDELGYS